MNYPALSDLSSESIIPPMGLGQPRAIGKIAVMVSTGPDFRDIKKQLGKGISKSFFTSTLFIPDRGEKGTFLENTYSFTGPYMGAPYGAALLESLIAKGAEKIIIFGWCGSVCDSLKTGDILIPEAAVSDEGTSRNYIKSDSDFPLICPDSNLQHVLIDGLGKKEIRYKQGKIWTTDAIYRETPEKVDFFKKKGVIAVEMECSALFSVAQYRKKDIAAVLVVSDEVNDSGWIPGFRDARFKMSRKQLVNIICNICYDMAVKPI